MKDCLVEFEVTIKWPPVNDKMTDVPVSQAIDDGRVELTAQEISDACECVRKFAMRTKLEMKIPASLLLKEYAKEDEITKLYHASDQLDNDDLNEVYTQVTLIEKSIKARRYERVNKGSKMAQLSKKIADCEKSLESKEPIYRTIRQTAKDQFREICTKHRKWLNAKIAILSKQSKQDDPISFIEDATERIQSLEQAWAAAKLQREPDIVEITYNITPETFWSTIEDFRRQLLNGVEKKKILGCHLLPHQVEVVGIPMKWFQVKLIGRQNEFTIIHTKHHNGYNLGFDNKEGQPYEMGPGNENDMGSQPEHNNSGSNLSEMTHLTIVGAKYVGFQCDYISMINPKKLDWSKDELMRNIEKFRVSIHDWLDSIHVLSYHDCDPEHHKVCSLCKAPYAVRRAMMCISVMLNECARIDALKEAVHVGILGMNLTKFLMQCIWLWKVMSILLRWYADNNNETEVELKVSNLMKVCSIYGLAQIMYLVLNAIGTGKVTTTEDQGQSSKTSASSGDVDGDKKGKGRRQDGTSSASDSGRDGVNKEQPQPPLDLGQTLLQIFYVTSRRFHLNGIRGILIHEEHGSHIIYSFGGGYMFPGETLNLCGQGMAISSEAGCILEFVPETGNRYGAIEHNLLQLDDGCSFYNQPRLKTMRLGAGSSNLTIAYAILTEAVEANLKIKLKVPSTGTHNVHGILKVVQKIGRTILSVDPADYVSVAEQPVRQRAPVLGLPDLTRIMPVNLKLSRSVLAVKLGELITVEGHLFIGNEELNISQVVKIPREIDIMENLKTSWVHDNGFSYCVSMVLICRNI